MAPFVLDQDDWVWRLASSEGPRCDCCGTSHDAVQEEVRWAAPGVTGWEDDRQLASLPEVSAAITQLAAAVDRLAAEVPQQQSEAQALVDAEQLLELEQRLRVLNLHRISDVAARGLHELVGHRSAKAWVREHRPDGDAGDARLATQLRLHSALRAAVEEQRVPLGSARKVALALSKVSRGLDRADGTIDGQPGDEVLPAVVEHVLVLVCRHLAGLTDDDPRLAGLVARAHEVLAAGSQLAVVEQACTWLAEHVPARSLAGPLDEIVVSLLPSVLEDREQVGHERRGLSLTKLDDGTGWHLSADLDLETGERLWTALRAEVARDPANPSDTAAWEQARESGAAEAWSLGADLAGVDVPRSRRKRMHDAFGRLLGRYLDTGLGGTHNRQPVQVSVMLRESTLTGEPGAPPPVTESGQLVPRRLVRTWWCDSRVTAFVLSLGGKALRSVHAQRMPSSTETRALALESGGRCIGDGCCSGEPDPLSPLRAHHVRGYAEDQATCLDDLVLVCDALHHDIHSGKRVVRLRDGRFLTESGFVEKPSVLDLVAPF